MPSSSRTCRGFQPSLRPLRRPAAYGAAAGLFVSLGCTAIQGPLPRPLPPNIRITPTPAFGARVDAAATGRVRLAFDQPMDRTSVQQVTRISFLLPVAVRDLDGTWNADGSAVEFDLGGFPTQPGALYEARFTGLRTAAGELYNSGPFELRFETSGLPDLFPMRPHPRVATRNYCRRTGTAAGPCFTTTLHADSVGTDSLRVHFTCEDCSESRDDFFRARAGVVEWLGWDDLDANERATRHVRWDQPLPVIRLGSQPGDVLEGMAQTAASGAGLRRWRSTHRSWGSPVQPVSVAGGSIEIVYSHAAIVDLDYALVLGGVEETHSETWWLLPGVGLVRRETRIQRGSQAPEAFVESFVPSLTNLTL